MASLVWEEAQKLGGIDPDFHRRDLWQSIESGSFPEWDFGVQVFPDTEDQMFEGIDLLDATKLVPEELAPVQIIGRLTLNRNPTNYFSETEQVAFCTAHVPRGIDFTDDPLLQARNFSYLDTQLTRLGGPNFDQLPINRPHSPVNTTQRDGFGQQAVPRGSLPTTRIRWAVDVRSRPAPPATSPSPAQVTGARLRVRAQSFSDHYSQATLFWESMTRTRTASTSSRPSPSSSASACSDGDQGSDAGQSGQRRRRRWSPGWPPAWAAQQPKGKPAKNIDPSPALSLLPEAPGTIEGRVVGIFVGDGVDGAGVAAVRKALERAGAQVVVIASHGGTVDGTDGTSWR